MPALFLSSGLLAYGVASFAGIKFMNLRSRRPELLRSAFASIVLILLLAGFVLLKPLAVPRNEPEAING
jgi:hypothetical protein